MASTAMLARLAVAALALTPFASAQCGSGTPDATVNGDGAGSYTANVGSEAVYTGADYRLAIQTAIDSVGAGARVSVLAEGSIGESTLSLPSGIIFEGCEAINVGWNNGRGAIESLDTEGVRIPYLTMTGAPYFGLRFYGVTGLSLGEIVMNLDDGLGIRFDRDEAPNFDVSMDSITVTGAGSHAVEVWNIDGLTIGQVIARDVGECGLLLQTTTNARVGLVDGENVAAGNGYATFRMANNNGQLADGTYPTNVYVDQVISRGGGRGIFCVSQSGGAEIGNIDLADNGNNAILIENCYGVNILGGTVNGGGEVRISARSEFPNTSDISIAAQVDGTTVRESPCGENINWAITGSAAMEIC